MARAAIKNGAAEVGMHLHAWDSPPISPLTSADHRFHPYLIDFQVEQMRAKIAYMTTLLEDTFSLKMRSHRAGRWAFNGVYARLLAECGYVVDCSVTPGHSWAHVPGAPGKFGIDYTDYPDAPYFLDFDDIRRAGRSTLLELPMTIRRSMIHRRLPSAYSLPIVSSALRRLTPAVLWLRPNGRNLADMLDIVDWAERTNRPYIEFMIHSSEFMPGGSPYFKDNSSVDKLYEDLNVLFQRIARSFTGATLSAFHDQWVRTDEPQYGKVG